MAADSVTVAIPVRNGGSRLEDVLDAARHQRLGRQLELLVADSGSTDGSVARARRHGAAVIPVAPGGFSHGGTRNLLFQRASGSHVAFLTQDAVPADDRWLARLLEGFDVADDVALVFGPYRPRADASPMIARELEEWFGSFGAQDSPVVDRGLPTDASADRRPGFFTDANGCVARWAWERVPFRSVAYAEDLLLARDMLAVGYAKVYHPGASVIHSHDYAPVQLFQRCFDEWRALRQVRGNVAEAHPTRVGLTVQRQVRDDLAYLRRRGASTAELISAAGRSLAYHVARESGAALGSRADRLPAPMRRACSLEGRV